MKSPVVFLLMILMGVLSVALTPALADEMRLVYENFPPFEYQENGEAKGSHIDMVRVVCSRIGVTPVFSYRPWARAIEEVQTGAADGVVSIFKNKKRETYLYFPDQGFSYEETVVFVNQDSPELKTIQDLAGLKVGVVREYFYGEGIREQLPSKVYEFRDGEMLLRMLVEQRIAAAIATRYVGGYLLEKMGYRDQIDIALVLSRCPLYIGFSKGIGERGKRLAEVFSYELSRIRNTK